jgi:hypothetical protein
MPDGTAAYRCGFRQGYIAAIGTLEVLLRSRSYPSELAFERALTFADDTLARWQLGALPPAARPPQLGPLMPRVPSEHPER